MDKIFNGGCAVIVGFIIWCVAWIAGWVYVSLNLVMPWLVSLGLVAWGAAIVSFVGMGFVFFWVFLFITIAITSILGAMLE